MLSTCGDLCWGVSIWCQWFFHLSSDILSWDHVKKNSESAFILVIHMWAICFPYTSFLSHITWVHLFELARKSERRKSEYPCEILKFHLFEACTDIHHYLANSHTTHDYDIYGGLLAFEWMWTCFDVYITLDAMTFETLWDVEGSRSCLGLVGSLED